MATKKKQTGLWEPEGGIVALAMDATERQLLECEGTTAFLRALPSGKLLRRFDELPMVVASAALSADGSKAVAGTLTGSLYLWDTASGCRAP